MGALDQEGIQGRGAGSELAWGVGSNRVEKSTGVTRMGVMTGKGDKPHAGKSSPLDF